jgi:hypothetical protein
MKVRGIANWAFVTEPDQKYHRWSIKLDLPKSEADRLRAVGIKVKKTVVEAEDGSDVVIQRVTISRNTKNKKTGEPNIPPEVVDAQLNPFTDLIGNGSEVIVRFRPYKWEHPKYGSGVGLDLLGVQVVNLVEYKGSGSSSILLDDDTDDGFEAIGGNNNNNNDDELEY